MSRTQDQDMCLFKQTLWGEDQDHIPCEEVQPRAEYCRDKRTVRRAKRNGRVCDF